MPYSHCRNLRLERCRAGIRIHAGLAWVALGYFAMSLLVQNLKYRWMGLATLLLTMCYVVVVGTSRFEPVYRGTDLGRLAARRSAA